jgi:hypothetical protein
MTQFATAALDPDRSPLTYAMSGLKIIRPYNQAQHPRRRNSPYPLTFAQKSLV